MSHRDGCIHPGDTIAFVDTRGTTWFGQALSGVRDAAWPTIRVRIGSIAREVPARDVTPWPESPPPTTYLQPVTHVESRLWARGLARRRGGLREERAFGIAL
ncbi:hypothetical protein [Pseudonocardia spinosispora]|uniref:hypothetical protein n=1 Tax=Pseudonocardia spinosispora TaxID=103441 RepID=UPI0012EB07FE|nr:hypothetical protein [Pseudonocardia spinosispora]